MGQGQSREDFMGTFRGILEETHTPSQEEKPGSLGYAVNRFADVISNFRVYEEKMKTGSVEDFEFFLRRLILSQGELEKAFESAVSRGCIARLGILRKHMGDESFLALVQRKSMVLGGSFYGSLPEFVSRDGVMDIAVFLLEIPGFDANRYHMLRDAADNGHIELVKLLLEKGVNPNLEVNTYDPVSYAMKRSCCEIIHIFYMKGASFENVKVLESSVEAVLCIFDLGLLKDHHYETICENEISCRKNQNVPGFLSALHLQDTQRREKMISKGEQMTGCTFLESCMSSAKNSFPSLFAEVSTLLEHHP